jgi:hypothetical protein
MRFFIKMCVSPLDLWSLGLSKNAYGEQTNKRGKTIIEKRSIINLICIKKAAVFAHNFRKTYSLNKNTSYICTVKRHFLG